MRPLRKPITPDKAMIRLEELCARAEHCTSELRLKLRDWGIATDDADAIILSLQKRRFVDDARFAVSFVRDRYRYARWGRVKIRLQLRAKRISTDIIEDALAEIDEDEYLDILASVLNAKARTLHETTSRESRSKLFRFAINRGFEPPLISSQISKLQYTYDSH